MGNIGKFRASEREYPLRNSFPSGESNKGRAWDTVPQIQKHDEVA